MDKEINNNGYEYVDLGLPSGTLWATMNVGAKKSSDYGLYFQWGDTNGYTKKEVRKDKQFTWKDYKYSINGSDTIFSKYTTFGDTLELEDDAANANMGGSWHMPTPKQIQELIDNTTSEWTKMNGVKGRLFTSKKNPSKSIFIPAAGYAWGGIVQSRGRYCFIWSSALGKGEISYGKALYFLPEDIFLGDMGYLRNTGFSVRGVIG